MRSSSGGFKIKKSLTYERESLHHAFKDSGSFQGKKNHQYKPSDLWDSREHAVFLKYCPSVRDRCYHAMANDMSASPHEILNLKIKDIIFKSTYEGIQYAEVLIRGGKTKPRTLPIIDSLPYLKEWLQQHLTGCNTDSWLFVSLADVNIGKKLIATVFLQSINTSKGDLPSQITTRPNRGRSG